MDALSPVVGADAHSTDTPEVSWKARAGRLANRWTGPDVRPEDGRDNAVESAAVLRAAEVPCEQDHADHFGSDQLLGKERQHHDTSLGSLRQPVRLRSLTGSSSDCSHHGRRVAQDVIRKVKKAALHNDGLEEVPDGLDKCGFEVAHHGNGTVEDCRPLIHGKTFNKLEEFCVGGAILPFEETEEHREGHVVSHYSVQNVQLRETRQNTSKSPVSENHVCCRQEPHCGLEAENQNLITVMFQKVMVLLLDQLVQSRHISKFFLLTETGHVDCIPRHLLPSVLFNHPIGEMRPFAGVFNGLVVFVELLPKYDPLFWASSCHFSCLAAKTPTTSFPESMLAFSRSTILRVSAFDFDLNAWQCWPKTILSTVGVFFVHPRTKSALSR